MAIVSVYVHALEEKMKRNPVGHETFTCDKMVNGRQVFLLSGVRRSRNTPPVWHLVFRWPPGTPARVWRFDADRLHNRILGTDKAYLQNVNSEYYWIWKSWSFGCVLYALLFLYWIKTNKINRYLPTTASPSGFELPWWANRMKNNRTVAHLNKS